MTTLDADALLVRSVPYGESDLVATFVTAEAGKVAAIVRGGRRSAKRFGGALEPVHTVRVRIDQRGGDLGVLREARLVRIRARVAGDLDALDCAGTALRWARALIPAHTAEEEAWATLTGFLDALDDRAVDASGLSPVGARTLLAVTAVRLLGNVGYGLELERCVGCQKLCPSGRPAYLDVRRGGLVCTACGGARRRIGAEARAVAMAAQHAADIGVALAELGGVVNERTAKVLLDLVHETLAAHVDLEP